MPDPDDHLLAELTALAGGTLPPRRRARLEARVAESPELAELLESQRRAVGALRSVEVRAPDDLRRRIARERAGRRSAWLRPPALAGGLAVAAAFALVLALVLPGGAAAPSVVEAAELATLPSQADAPSQHPARPKLLDARAEGLPFPDWAEKFGWRAAGRRVDEVGGRRAVTVFYEKEGRRIGYTILSGDALDVPGRARPAMRERLRLHSLKDDGRLVVTWRRDGRTCVLSGAGVERDVLLDLAAWPQ